MGLILEGEIEGPVDYLFHDITFDGFQFIASIEKCAGAFHSPYIEVYDPSWLYKGSRVRLNPTFQQYGIYAYGDYLIIGIAGHNQIIKKYGNLKWPNQSVLVRNIGTLGGNNSYDKNTAYSGIAYDGSQFYLTRLNFNHLQVVDSNFSVVLKEIDIISIANEPSTFHAYGLAYNNNGAMWNAIYDTTNDISKLILIHLEKEKVIYKETMTGNDSFGVSRAGKDLIRTTENNVQRLQFT